MKQAFKRNRILRTTHAIRSLVSENKLGVNDFIVPLFINEGTRQKSEISSMPGYYRMSLDLTIEAVKELDRLGFKAVLLFVKVPDELKDNKGTEALNSEGLMQRSIRAIKQAVPAMAVFTDVALDPFSSYGHDGIVKDQE